MSMERRFVAQQEAPVEIEERDGKPPKIVGYGAVFYREGDPSTEYELWPGVKERIMPGAFDRAIEEGDDVRGLFNHDPNMLLARTKSGTMKLRVFQKGLRYEIDTPDTQVGRDVAESIRRGDLTGSSFAFMVSDETWKREDEIDIREIRGVRLFDTGPVTYPAYSGSTTGLRAEGDVREARSSHDAWKAAESERVAEEQRQAALAEKLAGLRQRAQEVTGA